MNNIEGVKEYLRKQLQEFDELFFQDIINIKQHAINIADEGLANACWCLEHVYLVKKKYIEMFNDLYDCKYEKVWNELEIIEISLGYLYNNLSYEDFLDYGLDFIRNNIFSFQKLFPYFIFASRESVIVEEVCSICGKKVTLRNRCGHKIGKLYMGKLCLRKVEKLDIKAIAIVKNPMDKYAVLTVEGKEYDYTMLEELKKEMLGPYDKIIVETVKVLNPLYKKVGRNDRCPCGSFLKYKKCCLGTDRETIEHKKIIFEHPVKNNKFKYVNSYK